MRRKYFEENLGKIGGNSREKFGNSLLKIYFIKLSGKQLKKKRKMNEKTGILLFL